MKIETIRIKNYCLLGIRFLLSWTFLSYGISKITNDQFGISLTDQSKTVSELGLFKLSWYLFDQQPFRYFIGASQIFAAMLLLFNRTALIGALLYIPILLNILIIDITYIKMAGFYWRVSYYLFLDILILLNYREIILEFLRNIFFTKIQSTNFKWWVYLTLPITAILFDIIGVFPKLIYYLFTDTNTTLDALKKIPEIIKNALK